jgi:hypothetical protein
MKVIGKGPERPNRFLVAIWADGRDVYCRANIDRRRGRVDPDQMSGFTVLCSFCHHALVQV